MAWLINAAQLDKFRKNQKNVIILDATYHLPTENRDAKKEFETTHIAGARWLDLNEFVDPASSLPMMLLRDENLLKEKIGGLGVTNEHKIIFYDNSALHSSCRALWLFKVIGHNPHQLYILDGGFNAWVKYQGKTESGLQRNIAGKPYTINFQANLIRTLTQIKANLHHPREQVIDVRHAVRYAGGSDNNRPNMRSGHIPGAFSFPYMTMFTTEGTFKPLDRIRKQLMGIGVDLTAPIVTMCGSGVTAAILSFVLDLMNQENHSLYDGSWSEWGANTLFAGEQTLDERPVMRSIDT